MIRKISALILCLCFQINSFSQVHLYYDRGESRGTYNDNSYQYKLVHSKTIDDCSCKALFNYIEADDLHSIDRCLAESADLNCTIELKEDYWDKKRGFLGGWTERKWKISPYHFAVIRNRMEVVKRYEKIYGSLDSPMFRDKKEKNPKNILKLTDPSTEVYQYLRKQGVWTWEEKGFAIEKFSDTVKEIRKKGSYLDTLNILIESFENRKIINTAEQRYKKKTKYLQQKAEYEDVRNVLYKCMGSNIPLAYKYLLENYPFLCQDLPHERLSNEIKRTPYPTIELFEYSIEKKIIKEKDLRVLVKKKYAIPLTSKQLVSNYFYYHFQQKEITVDEATALNMQRKKNVFRRKLTNKNGL